MNEKKKYKHQEIGEQIVENEKIYNDILDETKNGVIQQDKEIEGKTKLLNLFKKKQIIRLGRALERSGMEPSKISAKLKSDLEGIINRSSIYAVCKEAFPHWTDKNYTHNISGKNRPPHIAPQETEDETETEQQKEYIKHTNEDIKKDENIDSLLVYMSGLSIQEQANLQVNTPRGQSWRNVLIEQSKANMFKLARRMTKTYINILIQDLRTLNAMSATFSDILYEERELRNRNAALTGQ
jgi:hypothetical protein